MRYTFDYGKGKVCFSGQGLDVVGILRVADYPPLADSATVLKEALARPIGCPPLKEIVQKGEKVAVIVNDNTRVANTYFFLPILLEEIKSAGIEGKNITIFIANGTHAPLSTSAQKEILGNELYKKYKVKNHYSKDENNLVNVGTTSRGNRVEINSEVMGSDRIILTGSIVYHFFAGYGGGRKALVPGVAGYNTISFNHSLMLEVGSEVGRLSGNPVHEDLLEAVSFVQPDFLLNVVLNDKKEFLGVFAGDYIQAHAAGCSLVDKVYGIPIKEKAELVIAGCGGYPKDINLYQAQKTLEHAARAVIEGGVIILLGQCSEGLGSAVLEDWLSKYSSTEEIFKAIRRKFVIGGHKAFTLARVSQKARIIMVSELQKDVVERAHFIPATDINKALRLARDFLGKENPSTYLMPQGSLTVPFFKQDRS